MSQHHQQHHFYHYQSGSNRLLGSYPGLSFLSSCIMWSIRFSGFPSTGHILEIQRYDIRTVCYCHSMHRMDSALLRFNYNLMHWSCGFYNWFNLIVRTVGGKFGASCLPFRDALGTSALHLDVFHAHVFKPTSKNMDLRHHRKKVTVEWLANCRLVIYHCAPVLGAMCFLSSPSFFNHQLLPLLS